MPQPIKDIRSIDGSDNHLTDTDINSANSTFRRNGPANFADGISVPTAGPDPRMISNVVVGEGDADVPNQEGLSGFMYAWGQFIDHDLDLSRSDGINHIDINIPSGDPTYPDGTVIPMTRAVIDPTTGAGTGTPATMMNSITGWLDGSMVYGSSAAVAASLRTADGHMLTDGHGNLPQVNGAFQAGDVRAQENPSLTALQTLFVREHNYQVDRLHAEHPDWTGDQLYEQARAIVGAEIAHITYSEYLPHLLGPNTLSKYHGYDAHVDARISHEFAGAAFRWGHSTVSNETDRIDNNGETVGPELGLKDTFFLSADNFNAHTGADGFLRHLGSDASQAMDVRLVDDLRNFLVDPPVGIDLAAINIQRGHDIGLGTLNQTRSALGLDPYTDFSQITDDQGTVAALKQAFGTVDQIDLWTGGLAEGHHIKGGMLGETFNTIVTHQFEVLRDGDRYWYEKTLDQQTLKAVHDTTLADIIERNTDTPIMQDDVFVFTSRHASDVASEHPEAPQLVIGQHDATVAGGPQSDTLVAGTGTQTMVGYTGEDQFVFHQSGFTATITDYTPGQDHLVFTGALLANPVQFEYDQNNTIVHVGNDTVTVEGVHLNPHDWLMA